MKLFNIPWMQTGQNNHTFRSCALMTKHLVHSRVSILSLLSKDIFHRLLTLHLSQILSHNWSPRSSTKKATELPLFEMIKWDLLGNRSPYILENSKIQESIYVPSCRTLVHSFDRLLLFQKEKRRYWIRYLLYQLTSRRGSFQIVTKWDTEKLTSK